MAGPPRHVTDPAEFNRAFTRIAEQSQRLISDFLQQQTQAGVLGLSDSARISKAFLDMTQHMLRNPLHLVDAQLSLWRNYWGFWQQSTAALWGQPGPGMLKSAESASPTDHDEWQDNFLFDFIKQSYLLTARCLQCTVAQAVGLDEQTRKRLDFYTRQFVDAMAPANFPVTNPEVLRVTLESGGENLLKGLQNLLNDLARGNHYLSLRDPPADSFTLGETLATTPGAVVYQNDIMQLLQYAPSTDSVFQRPLLAVPPWINKYYVLDLRPQNSLIKWWVDQGFTVFVISWVNPGPEQTDKDFADYLSEGILAALDAIEQATGQRSVNAVGYCLGGTLLACAAAYLSSRRERRLRSCTYLTSLLDFEQPGELEVFIDEEELSLLEQHGQSQTDMPVDNSRLAATFNMLRANDMIWSFFVEQYLLGKDSFPFDFLYWNSDSTRMPARLHRFYLRNMYQNNLLREPGGITLLGKPIDLSKIKTPSYYLATQEDHIALWHSVYSSARLFSGPVRFVLGGAGHVAGVINPPDAQQYAYWSHEKDALQTLENPADWLAGAQRQAGSWWQDWYNWVQPHTGPKVPARLPGAGKLPVLEAAPGSYAKSR